MAQDIYRGDSATRGQLFAGGVHESYVDFDGDRDWFKTCLVAGNEYVLYLRSLAEGEGQPLIDPHLRILDSDSKLIFADDNSGQGNHSKIVFKVSVTGDYFIDVGSANGQGKYRVSLNSTVDDFRGNQNTKGKFEIVGRIGTASGVLEQIGDRDAFKVWLKPGLWYDFDVTGSPHTHFHGRPYLLVKNLATGVRTPLKLRQRFYAETGGLHYLVVRAFGNFGGSKPTSYEVKVTEDVPPFISTTAPQTKGSSGLNLSAVISDRDFPIKYYHIYSDADLRFGRGYNIKTMPAGKVYRARAGDQFGRWSTLSTSGSSNVYIRGLTDLNGGTQTPWIKINANSQVATEVLSNARQHNGELTFAFANALPEYFSADPRFPTFQKLADHEKSSVREALRRWSVYQKSVHLQEVAPDAENDNATIMIFKSDIDRPVQGFFPGDGGGGDLVLDTDRIGSLRLGEKGFFEILKGIGNVFGLKSNSNYSRNESVLGRVSDQETFNGIYPTSPGTIDVAALELRYGVERNARTGNTTYRFKDGEAMTFTDFGGIDVVDGSGSAKVKIDLTPGASSYRLVNNSKVAYIHLAYQTEIENAKGSDASDTIFGNGWQNHLHGGKGNDRIAGRVGDDFLYGGENSDTYEYQFGDGHDVILEESKGGRDRLNITGVLTLNNFSGDLTFRKKNQGKDLEINLMLDGSTDPSQGSITIRDMNRRRSQVETLSLFDESGLTIAEVSLRSVFANSSTQFRRFQITDQSDRFGSLVAPA